MPRAVLREALGRTQGQAEFLLEQLTVKFGPQPVEFRLECSLRPVTNCTPGARRILAAGSVNEVFD